MNRAAFFYLVLILIFTPIITAQADCPETANGTHLWLGVDTSIPTPKNRPDLPDIDELDLLRVQLVWVPSDPERRYIDQHVIDIDWVQQTHTNVDVWDGELQAITLRDLHPIVLPIDTNFETGQIHIESCYIYSGLGLYTDGNPSAGPLLLFAYYGYDGKILETLVSPESVMNRSVSDIITNSFNRDGGLANRMMEDIGKSTGVTPGHYLAESFLFQNLEPVLSILRHSPTWFFDAENAVVMQNRVYVTANDASVSVPFSIGYVISNGTNVLDDDSRVHNLEQYLGTVQFGNREGWYLPGHNLIIDARPELKIETTPCVDGFSTLTADFLYPSELGGIIGLWREDQSTWWAFLSTKKYSWNDPISCDYDYYLEGRRNFESNFNSSGKIWVPVATAQ